MKHTIKKITALTLALVMILAMALSLTSCKKPATGVWKDAAYTEDKTLGEGSVTVKVEVKAEDKSVTFTIKTDEKILGEALQKLGLVEGEEGQFGLYVKKVNGILADYDTDGTYWAFYQDGKYMMTGIDMTEIKDGDHYELVREKG